MKSCLLKIYILTLPMISVLQYAHAETAAIGTLNCANLNVQVHIGTPPPRRTSSPARDLALKSQDFRNAVSVWIQEVMAQEMKFDQRVVAANKDNELLLQIGNERREFKRQAEIQATTFIKAAKSYDSRLYDYLSKSIKQPAVENERTNIIHMANYLDRASTSLDRTFLEISDSWARKQDLRP